MLTCLGPHVAAISLRRGGTGAAEQSKVTTTNMGKNMEKWQALCHPSSRRMKISLALTEIPAAVSCLRGKSGIHILQASEHASVGHLPCYGHLDFGLNLSQDLVMEQQVCDLVACRLSTCAFAGLVRSPAP